MYFIYKYLKSLIFINTLLLLQKMFTEIVLPNDNEQEFIEIASKLNIKKLYFLYDFDEEKVERKLNLIRQHKNIEIKTGFIINQKNINKALQQSKLLVAKSSDKDRFFIESKKIKLIYGFEEIYKKDYMHQRASGLNHIICELASKNNVTIGFSYSSLFNKNPADTPLLIGRMMQNITLCQKYKVKTAIGSFSDKPFDLRATYDIASLFAMLGMDGKRIKESLT